MTLKYIFMAINLKDCLEHGIFTDEIKALELAMKHDLLADGCYCSDECGILQIKLDKRFKFGEVLYCPVCKNINSILHRSIFSRTHLPVNVVMELIYYWAKQSSVNEAKHEVKVNKNTVTNFFQALRDACSSWVEMHNSSKIGGPGTIVEIDETQMAKRKSNAGRILPEILVVGGICRETDECFAYVVEDRTATTLEELIMENVRKGTTIHTDSWKGYYHVGEKGFTHKTVNHSKNFVNPEDGTHTQKIERFWRGLKDTRKRYQGLPAAEIQSHIDEYLWRKMRKVKIENCFEETIHMLAEVDFY